MPAELVKRINLDLLYPPFFERLLNVLAACRARGSDYYVTFGFRSWAEQHQLRALYLAGKGGKAAPAGLSAHNYGIAVDLAPDGDLKRPGLQPVWTDAAYVVLGEEVKRVGLVWGASFGDKPHVQWPGFVNGKELSVLNDMWKVAKGNTVARLKTVWEYLGQHQP